MMTPNGAGKDKRSNKWKKLNQFLTDTGAESARGRFDDDDADELDEELDEELDDELNEDLEDVLDEASDDETSDDETFDDAMCDDEIPDDEIPGDILEEELEEFDDEIENDMERKNRKQHSNKQLKNDLHKSSEKSTDSIPDEAQLEEVYKEELEELDHSKSTAQKNYSKRESAATREGNKVGYHSQGQSNYRRKLNHKKRQQRRVALLGIIASAVLIVLLGVIFLIGRLTPTKEMYDSYKYFEADPSSTHVMAVVDGEEFKDQGIYVEDQLYLPQEFVAKQINNRFYFDKESNQILYTDSETVYSFAAETTTFNNSDGNAFQSDYPVLHQIDGVNYVNFEFVAKRTNITYEYATAPARVVIENIDGEKTYVDVKKNAAVRYRAGIKSKILENVSKGDRLYYVSNVDDWTEVLTASGFRGYIKTSNLADPVSEVPENTFVENRQTLLKDYKINMAWYQVTNTTGNAYVGQYLANTSGLNTISPTWYTISDAAGNLSSLASSSFVDSMHARGLEVWPLLNDFDKNIDYAALFSSRSARTNMISKLIGDATSLHFDGINIDCENIKAEYAQDYLQFIRELSVQCQKNQIVLSIDNYKPASFNSFYNIKEQASFADYVIIMGYDEHYTGSDAGSVASLPFVKEGIEDALKLVPNNQLINAVPFYTRIWTVSDTGTTSKAVGMQAAIDNISTSGSPALWDDSVGQYFGSYDKDGAVVKIWFEEEKSIEEKMKVIQANDLAGVSAWKLGMEKPSVWSVINSYLGQ